MFLPLLHYIGGDIMTISLTKDEFLKRLDERGQLFEVAIGYDLKELKRSPNSPNMFVQYEDGQVELHEFIGKLVNDTIFRVIDLVYQDYE